MAYLIGQMPLQLFGVDWPVVFALVKSDVRGASSSVTRPSSKRAHDFILLTV